MAIKELQTRIALKYDSYSAWTTAPGKDLVLLAGELGICYIDAADQGSQVVPTVLFKVGNGTSKFHELPWASAKAADVYNWAKASNVAVDGKSIKFVGGAVDAEGNKVDKVITLNFATPEEVESKVATERARIAALEAKFGDGEGTVDKQIEAIDARLDAIEDAETGAVATAKAYTDAREVEIKKYADQAEADAKKDAADKLAAAVETLEAADSALDGRLDVIEGEGEGSVKKALADAKSYADQAELDAVASAKSYTDGRETAITTAYQTYADQAEADAKSYADGEISKAVGTINAKDSAQDAAIEKKLAIDDFNTYINGKSMSDADLKKYAEDEADAAESAAIAAAKTETEKQVKALADGAVAENAAAISAMDEAYKAADEALDGRLDTVEAKLANVTNVMDFRGAVEVLPASTEGYQDGDVIVVTGTGDADADKDNTNIGKEFVVSGGKFVEFGNTDANTSAITALQGRMDTAESDIDAAEQDIDDLQAAVATKLATDTFNTWKGTHENGHAKTATEITAEIGAAVKVEKDRAEGAEKAINDKIGTLPSDYTTLVAGIKAAKDQADKGVSDAAAVAGRMDTAEGEIDTLQAASHTHTNKDELDLIASGDKTKWDEAYNKRHEHANKAELDLIASGDKSKWDTAATNAGNAVADLAALTGTSGRIAVAEGNITTLQGIVNSGEGKTIRDDVTALQTLTGDASKGNGALRSELTTLQGIVNNETTGLAATKVIADAAKKASEDNDAAIKAIQADYLKAADQYIFNCGSSTTVVHEKAAN